MDIVGLLLLLAVFLGVMTVQSRIARTDQRVARIGRKVDLIIDHLGLRENDPDLEEVVSLLRDGKKIQAIKVYREVTGEGLKEAKDAVEALERRG
jgi:ribosomal protein L7/L12